jgi:hypothetical protein
MKIMAATFFVVKDRDQSTRLSEADFLMGFIL